MDELAIRAATDVDLDRVLEFWKEAAEGTSISDDRRGLAALIARDPGALLLAEHGTTTAGTVIAGFDGWRCHLYRLAVHPQKRRRGVATALLRAAEQRFVALGGRRADAMVLDCNSSAHGAWSAAGYVSQQQWSRWVKPLLPAHTGTLPGERGRDLPDYDEQLPSLSHPAPSGGSSDRKV